MLHFLQIYLCFITIACLFVQWGQFPLVERDVGPSKQMGTTLLEGAQPHPASVDACWKEFLFFFWCCFILLFVHSKPQSHLAFLKGSIWGSLIPHPAMVALAADLTATHAPFATWLKYVYLSTLYHALQRYKYKVYIYTFIYLGVSTLRWSAKDRILCSSYLRMWWLDGLLLIQSA